MIINIRKKIQKIQTIIESLEIGARPLPNLRIRELHLYNKWELIQI